MPERIANLFDRNRGNPIEIGIGYQGGMDVTEIYSPPRVTRMAKRMGLSAGWSLDLAIVHEIGAPSDFNQPDHREAGEGEARPTFVGHWPTDAHKRFQCREFQLGGYVPARKDGLMNARMHLVFWAKICRVQHEAGRGFLHEQPHSATS